MNTIPNANKPKQQPPAGNKAKRAVESVKDNADSGSLTMVGLVAWAAAEYGGVQLPPGISELVAGWIVMLGTRIKMRIKG